MALRQGESATLISHVEGTLLAAAQEREIPVESSLGSSVVLDYFTVPGPRSPVALSDRTMPTHALREHAQGVPPFVAEVVRLRQRKDASERAQGERGWIRGIVEPLVFFVLGTGAGIMQVRDMPIDETRRVRRRAR